MTKVLKFGGTSVGSAQMMMQVAEIACTQQATVVVLSAMSGTTDALIAISNAIAKGDISLATANTENLKVRYYGVAKELIGSPELLTKGLSIIESVFDSIDSYIKQPEHLDTNRVVAFGEILSTNLFTLYLLEQGIKASYISALDFMRLQEEDSVDSLSIERYFRDMEMDRSTIFITQGFIATAHDGTISNLGRGGSDYTAALIAAAMGASEVQIWSDIDGIHNNDPRFVDGTKAIDMICFEEAAELAYFGAKVLHPSTIQPCRERHIPVLLKNSMDPSAAGTIISDYVDRSRVYTAVAAKDGITVVRISSTRMLMAYGFLRRVFEIFERWRTPIDMITTSEVAVALTIDDTSHLDNIVRDLLEFGSINVERENSIVSVVGNIEYNKAGIARTILSALESVPVNMISYGASNRSMSLLVATKDKARSLQLLNNYIFEQC